MASAATALPYPDLHSKATPDDDGAAITVATALCMVVMILFLLTRLWIRWPFAALFSYDDAIAVAGSTVAFVQSLVIMVSVTYGLGQKSDILPSGRDTVVEKQLYAGSILYVVALSLGKLSIAFLFVRLSSGKAHTRAAQVLIALVSVWGIASIFIIALRQDISRPWGVFPAVARSTFVRWCIIESLGAVLEAFILAFSVFLVWNLQMGTKSKLSIVAGFFFRLPLLGVVAARLYNLNSTLIASPATVDPTFSPSLPEIFTQLEMHYNLICATVPCLKIFLKNFQTGFLGAAGLELPSDYYERSGTHLATKGSEKVGGNGSRGGNSGLRMKMSSPMELSNVARGETKSKASHAVTSIECDDAASDASQRRIMVRQTIDVEYEQAKQ